MKTSHVFLRALFSLLLVFALALPLNAQAATQSKTAHKTTSKSASKTKTVVRYATAKPAASKVSAKSASVSKKTPTGSTVAAKAVAAAPLMAAEPVVMRPPEAAIGKSASDVVRGFYSTLVGAMKEGGSFNGRVSRLQSAVDNAFNTREMMRTASGSGWVKASPEKQDSLAKAFHEFTVANYANQFKSFDGQKFDVVGEKEGPNAGEKIVQTTLTDGTDTHELNYLMRKGDKGWQIVDVYVDGTISEMATRRGEFGSVLRKDGPDALLNLLEQKSKAMGES